MHDGHEKAKRARDILKACGINAGADFEDLDASQVDGLLAHLDRHRLNKYGPMSKHRQPPGSVSSGVRSFHHLLQRRATPGANKHRLRAVSGPVPVVPGRDKARPKAPSRRLGAIPCGSLRASVLDRALRS